MSPVAPTTLVVLFRSGSTTPASLDEQTTLGISVDDGTPLIDPYWGDWSSGGGLRLTLTTLQTFVFADGARSDGRDITTQGMRGGRVVEDGQRLLFVLPHQPVNATMLYRAVGTHNQYSTYESDAWTASGLSLPYQSIVSLP